MKGANAQERRDAGEARRLSRAREAGALDTLVVLRPFGRGNWEPVELRISGRRAPLPMEFSVGQMVELCGQSFRVSRISSAQPS